MPRIIAKGFFLQSVRRQLLRLHEDMLLEIRGIVRPDRIMARSSEVGIVRMLGPVIIALALLMGACSQNWHMAPVRPYNRDLSQGVKFYKVKQGDTLYSIGFRSGHGYKRLSEWNNIPPPYVLRVGQIIRLSPYKQQVGKSSPADGQSRRKVKVRGASQKKPIHSTNSKKLLKFNWQWPIKGTIAKSFAQSGNKGIDIVGKTGQPVKAAAPGRVVYSGNGLIGYGNLLIIKHNDLFLSAYANNRRLLVKEGQPVRRGQIIAEVGRNGNARPMLHFEIRKNGKPVNPLWYFPRY